MHIRKIMLLMLQCIACPAIWMACDNSHTTNSSDAGAYIPQAPDYANDTLWYTQKHAPKGEGADVFYLVSTWEKDWQTSDGRVCHYADVYNKSHRDHMTQEISRIAEYMGDGNNFYAPFYRHTTIQTWVTLNEDTINNRFRLAFDDVQQAFNVFLKQREPNRPFILAGFSQGAKAVVELLKTMPEDLHRDLVAAYVLGYKVTPADTLASPNIKAAKDSIDLGVTICYNSVSDV